MKRVFFVLFILIFTGGLKAESLIEIDTKPVKPLKKIKSLALFRFDGKLINSGRISLVDYLSISYDHYKSLLKEFSSKESIKVSDTDNISSFYEEDEITALRSKDVPSYDEKVLSTSSVISKNPVKAIDVFLYGRINRYYKGRAFKTSYIDITIYLVDSKSKIVYWTTSIRGCLKYVNEAIVSIIISGDYTEPVLKDVEEFGWVNPYKARVMNWSFQYRIGYLIMMGELAERVDNGRIHNFAFDFKLPLWGDLNLFNQIELTLISSLDTIDEADPDKNKTFNTFVPFIFNFIYKQENLFPLQNLTPFIKAGFGFSYNKIFYSGLSRYREPYSSFIPVMTLGLGAEYRFDALEAFGYRFRTDKLGVLCEIDYLKWLGTDISSHAMNLSLGIKFYF